MGQELSLYLVCCSAGGRGALEKLALLRVVVVGWALPRVAPSDYFCNLIHGLLV